MLELMIRLDHKAKRPLYLQIYMYIKHEIMENRIHTNDKLPSIRSLSNQLEVSTITVSNAYQQLLLEGYVESRLRSGLYVLNVPVNKKSPLKMTTVIQPFLNESTSPTTDYDFNYGAIDTNSFDFDLWRKLSSQVIQNTNADILQYADQQGELNLRNELNKYLRSSRGVLCHPEQIIITSGTRQSIQLLSTITQSIDKGVAVESPCWPNALETFKINNFQTVGIPLDPEGISIESLDQSYVQKSFKYIYTTPSHQFPTGIIMTITRRQELLNWAYAKSVYIIEDDYDSEFRYDGQPIPSLQSLDKNASVIYMGTFSKSFTPSIRVSYLILPQNMLEAYRTYKSILGASASRINQKILETYMTTGNWERHIRKMRKIYHHKHSILQASIKKYFKFEHKVIGGNAGLHLLVQINNNHSEATLVGIALKHKIRVYPISKYEPDTLSGRSPIFLFGFGNLSPKEIDHSIKILGSIWS